MIPAVAMVSVVVFVLAFRFAGVVPAAAGAIATARGATEVMRDASLDDLAREKELQRASLRLFRAFGSILVRTVLTLGAASLPIAGAEWAGLAMAESVLRYLMRLDVIVVASAGMILLYVLAARFSSSK